MNIEEVLELLEIDSPDEFEYFEHFAELMECDEEITFDAFAEVISQVDSVILAELLDSYFEDVLKGIPDEETDLYTLISTIRQSLLGLVTSGLGKGRASFADELFRFRTWFTFESIVHCENTEDGITSDLPVLEALTLYRLEQLGEETYRFDFSDCLDYPLEEYTITISRKLETAGNDTDYDGSDPDYDQIDALYEDYDEGLIHRELPVIDGEFSDEDETV